MLSSGFVVARRAQPASCALPDRRKQLFDTDGEVMYA